MRSRVLLCALPWLLSLGCTDPASDGGPPNVVLVVLDAARADHFGIYGYDRDTTPAIDAFAAEATRYETVVSEASYTFLAVSSLLSARSPAVTGLGSRAGGIVPQALHLITETAREQGVATLAYSENPYVTHYFGLDQGFEVFEEAFPVRAYEQGRELGEAFDSAARLASILERASRQPHRPFFLYVHLLRPHNPYAPPPSFAGRFGSDPAHRSEGATRSLVEMDERGEPFDPLRIERIIALYDENLAYADALFGGVLADLELRGLSSRTIVILTSDHGEAFGEHGRLLHGTQVYDPMLRVPLVIRVPGARAGVERQPIQLADLGRGLRAVFLDEPNAVAGLTRLGRDRSDREPLYSWTNAGAHLAAARTRRRKIILDAKTQQVEAYHDLAADPDEKHSIRLDAEGEALRSDLRARIAEWTGLSLSIEPTSELDAEKRRQLEALGYLEPESEPGVEAGLEPGLRDADWR